jgi:hypothetical protein
MMPGDTVVALDQQYVARPQHGAQRIRVARGERLVAGLRALQVPDDLASDAAEHEVHAGRSPRSGARFGARVASLPPKLDETHCHSVHSLCDAAMKH